MSISPGDRDPQGDLSPAAPQPPAAQPDVQAQAAAQPAQAPAPQPEPDFVETLEDADEEIVIRRSPRYLNFILLGALLGAIVAFVLTLVFPENPDYSRIQVFGFLLLVCGVIGIALLSLVAILLERTVGRRVMRARADKLGARIPPHEPEGNA
ncbi:hypothetical protein [Leifsonia sp. ALI-44-B]|uniref:hypothetical protein n=1 Tax=Leifsonia sp. ALI-44-B TaxID=1933776 RepID=UPI0009F99DAF|nr:hypothetical protein [Leifsonia sp. ALI-44-B]